MHFRGRRGNSHSGCSVLPAVLGRVAIPIAVVLFLLLGLPGMSLATPGGESH